MKKEQTHRLFLLAINLWALINQIWHPENALTVMLLFWAQSMVLGVVQFIRILRSPAEVYFTTQGVSVTKRSLGMALFFVLHYGTFHLVFFFLIATGLMLPVEIRPRFDAPDFVQVAGVSILFLTDVFWRLPGRLAQDRKEERTAHGLLFGLYWRVLPLHVSILLAGHLGNQHFFTAFILLKLLAESITHFFNRS